MTGINPELDLVNMNANIKFGEILSICSQDIDRKQNFGLNQGYKCVMGEDPNTIYTNINRPSSAHQPNWPSLTRQRNAI